MKKFLRLLGFFVVLLLAIHWLLGATPDKPPAPRFRNRCEWEIPRLEVPQVQHWDDCMPVRCDKSADCLSSPVDRRVPLSTIGAFNVTFPIRKKRRTSHTVCCADVLSMMAHLIHKAAQCFDVEAVAVYGTALGSARNQRIIPHTNDVDFAFDLVSFDFIAASLEFQQFLSSVGLGIFLEAGHPVFRVCPHSKFPLAKEIRGIRHAQFIPKLKVYRPAVYADFYIYADSAVDSNAIEFPLIPCAIDRALFLPVSRIALSNGVFVNGPRDPRAYAAAIYGQSNWKQLSTETVYQCAMKSTGKLQLNSNTPIDIHKAWASWRKGQHYPPIQR